MLWFGIYKGADGRVHSTTSNEKKAVQSSIDGSHGQKIVVGSCKNFAVFERIAHAVKNNQQKLVQ